MDWLDISTAPKDGTVILVGVAGSLTADAAYWSQCPKATGGEKAYPWVILDPTNQVNGLRDAGRGAPTHWMPLPAPPADDQ